MKRAKSLFNQIVTFENLRLAWLNARKGKTNKPAVRNFARNVNENLLQIQRRMCAMSPVFSSYVQFKINDPKERIISVVPFSDRVMHHAIIAVLEPLFERQCICHTYACRKGKGTHAAARYAFKCARRFPYFLKLDVRKYFDSIDHTVLKRQLCRIIKDSRCLALLFSVIESYETSENCGLPIGNLTSQFFANLYLSPLDHLVLEQLQPRAYVRYMDDMVLFADSMADLHAMCAALERFCHDELKLSLKPAVSGATLRGVPFLGWRIAKNGVYLLSKTRRRMRRRLVAIAKEYAGGAISEQTATDRTAAVYASRRLLAFTSHGACGTMYKQ